MEKHVGVRAGNGMRRWLSTHARTILIVVSGLGVLHFTLSLLAWGGIFLVAVHESRHGAVNWHSFLSGLPAVLLFGLFLAALLSAFRSTRRSCVLVLVALGLFCMAFAYDAATRNWQLHVETHSGPGSGPTFRYCTWWWYRHY